MLFVTVAVRLVVTKLTVAEVMVETPVFCPRVEEFGAEETEAEDWKVEEAGGALPGTES